MKVGIIADVHSNIWALGAVLGKLGDVERIVCAGDITGSYTRPNEVVKILAEKNVLAVLGEHDRALLSGETRELRGAGRMAAVWSRGIVNGKTLRFLKKLRPSVTFRIGGRRVLIAHRTPGGEFPDGILPDTSSRDVARAVMETDADIIILGHTHIPLRRMALGKIIVNPGSVGQPRDRDPRASYAILKLGEDVEVEFHRAEYDVDAAAREVIEVGLDEELATRLKVGW
ncbi:MAG: metallophosphoesterase family protein [Candidatus Hadarchaeales archaeon]